MKISASGGAAAVLAATLLAACGAPSEQGLLASARTSLAAKDDRTALIQIKNVLQANPDSAEGRFLLGSVLLDEGDPVAAELELRKAAALKFAPEQVTPRLAAALLAQAQYKKLVDEFGTTTLATAAGKADLDTSLAYSQAMLGDKSASDASLKSALAADPAFVPALVAQARFIAGSGDADSALAHVDEILKHEPRSAEAWRLRGDILTYLKSDPDQALVDYRKALDADPNFATVHVAILTILLQQQKADEAEKQLAQLRKLTGNNGQTIYIQALIAYMRRDMGKTRELAQQLLKVAPESSAALLLAGGAEMQGGSLLQAQAYLEHAVQVAPDAKVARRMLVSAYLRSNQPDRALAALRPGGKAIPPELYAVAGETYLQNGDVKTAGDYFDKAARLDPTNAAARTSLAMTHLVAGDASSAFSELQEIAASDKGDTADLALIGATMKRGDYDKALAAVDVLQRKQPDQPLAPNLRGRILLARQDVAGARRSFEQAAKIAPSFYPAVASLAALDVADGKTAEARQRLQDFASRNPRSSQPFIALARLDGTSLADSIALLNKAVAAEPTQPMPRLLLVQVYLDQDNNRLAQATVQDAAAVLPDSPEIVEALGRVQEASGDLNQALATYGRLADMQPGDPSAALHLAEVQMRASNLDAARDDLLKAIAITPNLVEAQRKLAFIDASTGRAPEALEIARTVQRQRPGEGVGDILEGDISVASRDGATAADVYRRGLKKVPSTELAIKLDSALLSSNAPAEAAKFEAEWRQQHPDDAGFVFHLGDVATMRKDYAGAEARYLAVVKMQPRNAAAFNNLAWASSMQGKDTALGYAETANRLAPDQPAYMDTLANVLSGAKQYDRALALQKRVVELLPGNADFKLELAKLYLKSGDKDGARAQLDQLASLGPKYPGQSEVSSLRKSL